MPRDPRLGQPASDGHSSREEQVDQGFEQTLNFTAVNTSETPHDTYDAFLAGVGFGLATGALIALIQELVAPFRSRRELRPPDPGG